MSPTKFNDASYTELIRKLIGRKGGEVQANFLQQLKDREKFVGWMRKNVQFNEGEGFMPLRERLSENEFKNPPLLIEEKIYKQFENLAPATASEAIFWGYTSLTHIEGGVIEPHYLAGQDGGNSSGRAQIDQALKGEDAEKMDGVVRTALRQLSGLTPARGYKSVYVDCPFARAWWRRHIAKEVHEVSGARSDPEKVLKTLRVNKAFWEELIVSIVSRNSVFGDNKIRSALIWALSELYDDEEKRDRVLNQKKLKEIMKLIGTRLAWQELAIFSVKDLKQMFETEFIKR